MATCKDLDALRQQFPCAPAWGQPGLAGETDEDNDEEAAPSGWAMGLTGVLSPEQQYKRSCLRLRMDIAFVSVVCVRARM